MTHQSIDQWIKSTEIETLRNLFFFIISLTHQSIDRSPNELSPQQNNQNVDTLKLCKSIRGSPGSITHKFKFWGRRGELEKLAFYLKGVNLNHNISGVSYIHLGCLNHPNSINLDKQNSPFKKECAKPNKQTTKYMKEPNLPHCVWNVASLSKQFVHSVLDSHLPDHLI